MSTVDSSIKSTTFKWSLATLSGCLNGAAFIFYGPLTLIANLPLLLAVSLSSNVKEASYLGAWVGFIGGCHIYGVINYGWWIFWAFSFYTASQMIFFGGGLYLIWNRKHEFGIEKLNLSSKSKELTSKCRNFAAKS